MAQIIFLPFSWPAWICSVGDERRTTSGFSAVRHGKKFFVTAPPTFSRMQFTSPCTGFFFCYTRQTRNPLPPLPRPSARPWKPYSPAASPPAAAAAPLPHHTPHSASVTSAARLAHSGELLVLGGASSTGFRAARLWP